MIQNITDNQLQRYFRSNNYSTVSNYWRTEPQDQLILTEY